jgi:hypothetical protein
MLRINEMRLLLDDWHDPEDYGYVAVCLPDKSTAEQIEAKLKEIRDRGFFCMLRLTAFGTEIVITDLRGNNGNAGSSRSSIQRSREVS